MNALTPIECESAVRLAGTVSGREAEMYFHALRGRLINEFALAAEAVDEVILRLCNSGKIQTSPQLASRSSTQRLNALREVLRREMMERRHVAKAVDQLDRWGETLPIRHALVHGALTVHADELAPGGWVASLRWHGRGTGDLGLVDERWDMTNFGQAIVEIAEQRRVLGQQLAQIGRRSHCPVVQG